MQPWLGCLWKVRTEGKAQEYETKFGEGDAKHVQAASACGLHSQERPVRPEDHLAGSPHLHGYMNIFMPFSSFPAAVLRSAFH